MSITASEPLVLPAVEIAGQTALVSGTGTSFTATYTVVASAVEEGASSVGIVFRDLASNAGVDVTSVTDESVVVIDLTPPTLPTVTIASGNAADATKANVGDTISLTIVADEDIVTPTVSIAGLVASVSGSGSAYVASSLLGAADKLPEGRASFSITFEDTTSNAGVTVTATTDSSLVRVDLTSPTLTTVSVVSSNVNDVTRANVGDTITISIVTSEPIIAPSVMIAEQMAAEGGAVNGEAYAAEYTLVDGSSVVEGVASLRFCSLILRATQESLGHQSPTRVL